MSYFTGILFTVYQLTQSEQAFVDEKTKLPVEGTRRVFLFKGNDYSNDLNVLLEQLEKRESKSLVITL